MSFTTGNERKQDPLEWVQADMAFQESYTTAGLNRKLAGVLPVGVHWGFQVVPAASGVRMIKIYAGDDPDYPKSVVVFERDNFSITGRADGEYLMEIPAGFEGFLVLEAIYALGITHTAVRLVETPESHHVVLAKLKVPTDAQVITPAMIDYESRTEGNVALILSNFASIVIGFGTSLLNTGARVALLEEWAETQGYEVPDLD